MDIYSRRSGWKILLAIFGVLVLLATILYANYLANQLKQSEERNINIYKMAVIDLFENITEEDYGKDITFQDSIRQMFPLPIIIEDIDGILTGQNWSDDRNENQPFLERKKKQFLDSGRTPLNLPGEYASKFYFFNSRLLNDIKYFPLVPLLLVASFILFGYFLFSTSRRAEQSRVWAGMAKETAHQLGTPISAILAWLEHLKLLNEGNDEQLEIVDELEKDVDRLNLVADRFSKIGSAPDLKTINVIDEVNKCREYMERRSPRKVTFDFPSEGSYMVNINEHLFDWVIENLMRNSLDAMDGKGQISATVYELGNHVCIDLSDTGKGIPSSKFATVFKPGYSTKQRGWGLGLSLAKRIIEEYHKGKIYVKTSKVGEGTTFTIKLPKIKNA